MSSGSTPGHSTPTRDVPPAKSRDGAAQASQIAVRAVQLRKSFPLERNVVGRVTRVLRAVDGVDLEIERGRTLGIVGESGSGKTTVGRLISRLEEADSGRIEVGGVDMTHARGTQLQRFRSMLQIIFQDPYGALDPTKTIGHAVAEPLLVQGKLSRSQMAAAAGRLLETVALDPGLARRYPRELSGGQRQRICIARALALGPQVLVADEPTSALDLSTRSEILNLLMALQKKQGQTIVLISHDFATVRHLSHRIAVMYRGRVVEDGPTEEVVENPRHPYTQALLSAVPVLDPDQRGRERVVPLNRADRAGPDGSGCKFRARCPVALDECARVDPPLFDIGGQHGVACLHAKSEHTDNDRSHARGVAAR
jgi:oligopeptide/dipeptide ABC transporter ATP-binding protein